LSTKILIWAPLIEVEPPIPFNVSRYREVKKKTERYTRELEKEKNKGLKRIVDVGL
jgi:hypothetical protein